MKTCTLVLSIITGIACANDATADNEQLANQAQQILRTNCYRCHGQNGTVEGGLSYVLDRNRLVERGKILPGKPDESPLFKRMIKGRMPPKDETPRPSANDLKIIEKWITAGAPAAGTTIAKDDLLNEAQLFRWMRDDLETIPTRSRRFIRYLTLASVYNQGLGKDELQAYRNAVNKLINSLSWHPKIANPKAIDPKGLVLRLDLRDYLWDATLWNLLLKEYPYGVMHESSVARAVVVRSGTRVPCVRADWFLANACRPPLYYELLQIPGNSSELEQQLRVNVALNIIQERVARAGFNNSGISQNNRIIERHDSLTGAYWRTYDFEAVEKNLTERINLFPDRRNVFAYPLGPGSTEDTFQHAGGEIIFHLPNGLLGFMLVDKDNLRIDKGPTQIVSDPRRPDRAVEPGVSCMSCHRQGFIPKEDQLRDHVRKNTRTFDREIRTQIDALHPWKDKFLKMMSADSAKFQKALELTGNQVAKAELVSNFTLRYEAGVDLSTLATEVGMTKQDFLAQILSDPEVARHIDGLKSTGVTLSRETIEQAWPFIAQALRWGIALEAGVVGEALPDNTGERDPLEGETQEANGMIFSQEGDFALIASADRSVRLFDVEARRDLKRFIGHRGSVWSIAISSNGDYAASGSADRTVKVWDTETGKELATFKEHFGLVTAVTFSPDNRHLLSAGLDHSVIYRNWETDRIVHRWDNLARYVNAVAITPEGERALICADRAIRVVSLKTGKEIRRLVGHTDAVNCVVISRDGRTALTGSDDGTARLWDLQTGNAKVTLKGHQSYVKSVAMNRDASQLLTGGTDRVLRLWDVKTGKVLREFDKHQETILAMTFSPGGDFTLSGSRNSVVRPWKLNRQAVKIDTPMQKPPTRTETTLTRLRPQQEYAPDGRIGDLKLPANGRWLYYLDVEQFQLGRIDVEKHAQGKPVSLIKQTSAMTLTPDGSRMVTMSRWRAGGKAGGTLQIIDLSKWKSLKTITMDDKPCSVAADDHGRIFVSVEGRGWSRVLVMDATTGKVLARWGGVWTGAIVKLSHDQKRLYVASQGVKPGTLQAFVIPEDLSEKPVAYTSSSLQKHDVGGNFLLASDGTRIVSMSGAVLRTDADQEKDLELRGYVEPFLAGAMVPEKDRLLTLNKEGDLIQYSLSDLKKRETALLSGMGYRVVADAKRGRAYVAVVSSRGLASVSRGRIETVIHVYPFAK